MYHHISTNWFILKLFRSYLFIYFFKFYSYTWQILLRCKAGGIYNATGTETQHMQGTIDDITVFMDKTTGS